MALRRILGRMTRTIWRSKEICVAMMHGPGPRLRPGEELTNQRITPGTVRRIVPYALRHRWALALLMTTTALDAIITVAIPLMLGFIIDDGITPHRLSVVVLLASVLAGLAVLDALANYFQNWCSAWIGESLIYDLRTKVFANVQRQSLAFFTRTQTGSLVSRLNTDVIGAQQAVTTLLSQSASTVLTLIFVVGTMFFLSWQISVVALALIPLFALPAKLIGRRLQRLARQEMQLDAELGSMMNERFNVAGAMLVKLYGRSDEEMNLFTGRARRVRDIAILQAITVRAFTIIGTLLTALTIAAIYGLGGDLVINNGLKIGTLVALAALLLRLYGPVNQLSNIQGSVVSAVVSFDRVFEVLDLKPLICEQPEAVPLHAGGSAGAPAADIVFDHVSFRYPQASQVTIASLELTSRRGPDRTDDTLVLNDVSFRVPAGSLTALVGPSGAGKTTITHLVPRLYDPGSGTVRIGGQDLTDVTLQSLHDSVGVVPQDSHMFHDTIRANLSYARPEGSEDDLIEACKAAQIWDTISRLPDGLDTIVGDRGYRLSGGEKQRVALARLLLKSPPIVVLDEATAHLDSESEAAIQRALKTALAGRTSLVIAHRLSTIRDADQILVINAGQIAERGTHDELLAAGGLYAELYRTQFMRPATASGLTELAGLAEPDGHDPDGMRMPGPDLGPYHGSRPPGNGRNSAGRRMGMPPPWEIDTELADRAP
jgi:ATP-binding cassette, subfamily B, bacterial